MLRLCSALAFALACAFAAQAEGPGSRIGTTPELPRVPPAPSAGVPQAEAAKRCDALTGMSREQCLADLRNEADRRSHGPESIGGSSGAGSSAASGTTGGGSFGGSAPR